MKKEFNIGLLGIVGELAGESLVFLGFKCMKIIMEFKRSVLGPLLKSNKK
jgi:hypothetical protein